MSVASKTYVRDLREKLNASPPFNATSSRLNCINFGFVVSIFVRMKQFICIKKHFTPEHIISKIIANDAKIHFASAIIAITARIEHFKSFRWETDFLLYWGVFLIFGFICKFYKTFDQCLNQFLCSQMSGGFRSYVYRWEYATTPFNTFHMLAVIDAVITVNMPAKRDYPT